MTTYTKQNLTTTYPAFNVFTREAHAVNVYNASDDTYTRIENVVEITEKDTLILKTEPVVFPANFMFVLIAFSSGLVTLN
jgi:hypothetical protein